MYLHIIRELTIRIRGKSYKDNKLNNLWSFGHQHAMKCNFSFWSKLRPQRGVHNSQIPSKFDPFLPAPRIFFLMLPKIFFVLPKSNIGHFCMTCRTTHLTRVLWLGKTRVVKLRKTCVKYDTMSDFPLLTFGSTTGCEKFQTQWNHLHFENTSNCIPTSHKSELLLRQVHRQWDVLMKVFLTLWPWQIPYDLDLQILPRYLSNWPSCQNWVKSVWLWEW